MHCSKMEEICTILLRVSLPQAFKELNYLGMNFKFEAFQSYDQIIAMAIRLTIKELRLLFKVNQLDFGELCPLERQSNIRGFQSLEDRSLSSLANEFLLNSK